MQQAVEQEQQHSRELLRLLHQENELWQELMIRQAEWQEVLLSILQEELANHNFLQQSTLSSYQSRLLIVLQHCEERQKLMLQQKEEQLPLLQIEQLMQPDKRNELLLLLVTQRREQRSLRLRHMEELNLHK